MRSIWQSEHFPGKIALFDNWTSDCFSFDFFINTIAFQDYQRLTTVDEIWLLLEKNLIGK
jgi:hypothetical protein